MVDANLSEGTRDVDRWYEQLLKCEPLSEQEVKLLCKMVFIA